MDADELHKVIKRTPFSPVRIHLSDGSHYDIAHPDQIMVMKRWSYVGLPADADGPYDDDVLVDNLHITRVEPVRSGRRKAPNGCSS